MSNTLGKNIKFSIAGESHGDAIGMILSGIPAGFTIDMEALSAFLSAVHRGKTVSPRPEKKEMRPCFYPVFMKM